MSPTSLVVLMSVGASQAPGCAYALVSIPQLISMESENPSQENFS